MYCLQLFLNGSRKIKEVQQKLYGPQSQKYLLSSLLQKAFADLSFGGISFTRLVVAIYCPFGPQLGCWLEPLHVASHHDTPLGSLSAQQLGS